MQLQESGEMYLKHILLISEQKPEVHAIDIAVASGYSKPSVSRAVGILQEGGYIKVDPSSKAITLTKAGMDIATKLYERQVIMSRLLMDLGVDARTADDDACKMEHILSDASFRAIKRHIRNEHPNIIVCADPDEDLD